MRFALRPASAADVDGILTLWQQAAENDSRPPDTAEAVLALLGRAGRVSSETRKMADEHLSIWLRGSRGVLGLAYLTLIPQP